MKAAVIVFPGSNCDRDLSIAFEKVTGTKTKLIWHKDAVIPNAIAVSYTHLTLPTNREV